MFDGAVNVGEELKAKISTFKNQRDTRRIGFRALFDKLGTSLERLIKAVEENKPLKGNMRELEMCVKGFPGTVGDIIGLDKTDELTACLKESLLRTQIVGIYLTVLGFFVLEQLTAYSPLSNFTSQKIFTSILPPRFGHFLLILLKKLRVGVPQPKFKFPDLQSRWIDCDV